MSEKAKYTPGPWVYCTDKYCDWGTVMNRDKNAVIANANSPGVGEVERDKARKDGYDPYESNARLIAAAPELLEALDALIESPIVSGMSAAILNEAVLKNVISPFDNAKSAIAKAKGEQQ